MSKVAGTPTGVYERSFMPLYESTPSHYTDQPPMFGDLAVSALKIIRDYA
ncbi:MAG: hypothetical protein JSW48_02340 [Betaproteobacteria bacterium]|nr:MAG: hypothetical protein JSW48_02340 [Betaproteobacteria bacterium]